MRGPAAPKDPTKKRPCLYIMLDKDIAGLKGNGGECRDTNYMEGRLVQQVKGICGDVDQKIYDLLENTDGIVKLVHSLGISITATQDDQKKEFVDFTMQCYGKVDKYATGTNVKATCPCNGEEVLIPISESGINEKDNIIGAFHFDFNGLCKAAKVTLKFYLNDGYTVPEIEVDPPIDYNSEKYAEMIDKSLLNLGNTKRLKKAIDKAKNGEEVVVAYIGGSITQGAGAKPINTKSYAYLSYVGFCDLFTKDHGKNVKFVKAGVGGTPSELGMLRYERDVTDNGKIEPDIVIIEFAVNDEGDETEGVCFESLVRKIANAKNKPAVILNFAVFMSEWNLEDRLVPIGKNYDLPMVSLKASVIPQFDKDTVITKRQYFYDIYHPTNDGHKVMADCLINLFKTADEAKAPENDSDFHVKPVKGAEYENVELIDKLNVDSYFKFEQKGFDGTDHSIQHVERDMDDFGSPVLENNWAKDNNDEDAYFTFEVECKNLLIISKDSGSDKFGDADYFVDDKLVRTATPLVNGWDHTNPQVVINETETAKHKVMIKMHPGNEKKLFTILGFGITK